MRDPLSPVAPTLSPVAPVLEIPGIASPRPLREEKVQPATQAPPLVSMHRYAACLVALDAAVATLATIVALHLRLGSVHAGGIYSLLTVLLPIPWVVILLWCGCYERRDLVVGPEEYRRIAHAGMWLLGVVAVSSYVTHADFSRALVAITTPLIIAATIVARLGARRLLHRRVSGGRALHRVVVAGPTERSRALIRHLRTAPHAGLCVVGACVPGRVRTVVIGDRPVPVLGAVADVAAAAQRAGADTIAIAGTDTMPTGALRRLSWELEGTGVHLVVAPSITDIAGPRILVRPLNGLPLLHVEEPTFTGGTRLLKGMIDRALALLMLLLFSPLLVGIMVAIHLGDPGPVFFRQVRVGHLGRRFVLWKFRTMRVGAELERDALLALNEHDGLLFKIRRDPRVTPIGRWLRRHSLDELPQLWNVLGGSMSLVGPRPPLPAEADQYPDDVQRRLLVKPGLTGLWQVSGRSDLSWEETVRLDLHYVENWSVARDVLLLWKTVAIVLRGAGGY
jgi:exopolysaccharide biosynthesis polyprenyl glycosylphosphotransferase